MFYVIDSEFNQHNYPTIIGKIYDKPPGYAQVKKIPHSYIVQVDGELHSVHNKYEDAIHEYKNNVLEYRVKELVKSITLETQTKD